MARNDAVRFDLKEDRKLGNGRSEADCLAGVFSGIAGSSFVLKSMNSPSSISTSRSGWSYAQSKAGEYRSCRLSEGLFWLAGVGGCGMLDGDARSWARDGMESLELDRAENEGSVSDSTAMYLSCW